MSSARHNQADSAFFGETILIFHAFLIKSNETFIASGSRWRFSVHFRAALKAIELHFKIQIEFQIALSQSLLFFVRNFQSDSLQSR